jgi:spermidine/putrescine transport system ATP-binding protein
VATFIGEINLLDTPAGRAGLRPERVRLTAENAGRAAGVLEEVAYHGASRRCTVKLDDGHRLVVREGGPVGEIGSRVGAAWEEADVVLLGAARVPPRS